MRFAYADPPYLGQGQRRYGEHHDEAHLWDRPSTHLAMVETLINDYPDGFAISLHEPSLQDYLGWVPRDRRRICVWFKTFAAFKPNVRVAYTWEPLIVVGGRRRSADGAEVCTDVLREPITMQRGLPGAKPERFCSLVLEAADGSTVTVGAAMTQARLMPELPVELYTVVRVTWADANPPSDVLTLVPGKRSGVVAWEGLSGAWGAQALAEEITGHEILARPV